MATIPANTVSFLGNNLGKCNSFPSNLVYVDVSELSGPLQLAVLSTNMDRKRFKIRICQLADSCSGSLNCLQYYTGLRGVISSFNYDQSAMFSRSEPGYFVSLELAFKTLQSLLSIAEQLKLRNLYQTRTGLLFHHLH